MIGPGVGGLAVLAVFSAWERASSHPMLNIQFFRRQRCSAAVSSVGLVTFGLFGALFVLTQYLQFSLGLFGPASRDPRAASGRGHRGHRTLLHRPRPRHRNQAMFAESTSLHDQAVKALAVGDRPIGLLEFEDHLLDRGRPWAGTGGKTLKDLGYGFLGQYRRHVKDHINTLLDLSRHTCVADPHEPFLITTALRYGRHHKGMPKWPVIVERIGILLADPAHPAWGTDGRGAQALAEMPRETPSPEGLTAALLSAPSSLPVTVLEWLSHHLLCCAAPPYSLRWDEQSRTG